MVLTSTLLAFGGLAAVSIAPTVFTGLMAAQLLIPPVILGIDSRDGKIDGKFRRTVQERKADFIPEEQALLTRYLSVNATNVKARLTLIPEKYQSDINQYSAVVAHWVERDPLSSVNYTLAWLVNDLDKQKAILDTTVERNILNSSLADEIQEFAVLSDKMERMTGFAQRNMRGPKKSRIELVEANGRPLGEVEIAETKRYLERLETYQQSNTMERSSGD